MPAQGKAINLLPASEFEQSFWGKFLRWAITAGRYIIIVTELVVILAFLSRFKLDRDLADLTETIEGQKSVLEAQAPSEAKFREVQSKLTAIDRMLEKQMRTAEKMDQITGKLSSEVKLTSLIISPNQITLEASSLSERAIGEMLVRIASDKEWGVVNVTDFSADGIRGVTATLTIEI